MSQKKYDITHAFSSVTDPPTNTKSIDTSQDTSIKDTHIIHSTINLSIDIGTRYGFRRHHYLRGKIALSLSSSINSVCIDTDCSVTLCNVAFFSIQVPNTTIQKIANPIPIQADIISAVRNRPYISVIDYISFFFQWRVHPAHQHRLMVVSY